MFMHHPVSKHYHYYCKQICSWLRKYHCESNLTPVTPFIEGIELMHNNELASSIVISFKSFITFYYFFVSFVFHFSCFYGCRGCVSLIFMWFQSGLKGIILLLLADSKNTTRHLFFILFFYDQFLAYSMHSYQGFPLLSTSSSKQCVFKIISL